VNNREVLIILDNYITKLYDWPNRPENLEAEPEEEVGANDKGPYSLRSEVEKAIKGMRNKRLEMMMMYLGMYSNC